MTTTDRADYTALSDRMAALPPLRLASPAIVVAWGLARPEVLGMPRAAHRSAAASATPRLAVAGRVGCVATPVARGFGILTAILLLDGLYLAWAMYATGGTQSPIRFLIYLHLVAVSLLASYRTGPQGRALGLAAAVRRALRPGGPARPAGRRHARRRPIEFERMPVLNVLSFWLFALATSVFSAMNERELRHRRADLQALVDIGARLDDVTDPVRQSQIVLDGLAERFGFERGVVLGASDDQMVVLASCGTDDAADHRAAPRRDRRPGLGPARASSPSAGSSRLSTRSWPRSCPTPATSWSRR